MRTRFALLFVALPFLASAKDHVPKRIYDFKIEGLDGKTIDFSKFHGKKILIVNTASLVGNNPQYAELETAYQKYKGKLVIVGILDKDFGAPPGSQNKIKEYAKVNYNVSFPMGAKVLVKGPDRAPIYKWLTDVQYNKLKDTEIKWDFQKYLINEQGELVAVFDPNVKVTDPEIIAAIEK
jgi:glutathione peroxidase